jgi:hypothetical protein
MPKPNPSGIPRPELGKKPRTSCEGKGGRSHITERQNVPEVPTPPVDPGIDPVFATL